MTGFEQFEVQLPDGSSFPQSIHSRTFSGRNVLRGYGGPDTLLTGVASDFLDGGNGNDTLDPGAGPDTVWGGAGNDSVSARDGSADLVDCGDGSDTVVADRADVLSGCESVSLPPPDTGKIIGPKKTVKGQKATFTFTSEVAGAAFECQVDGGAFKACTSPFKVKTKKLKVGKHTLKVRAVQPAGNLDPTPSTFKFKVVAP